MARFVDRSPTMSWSEPGGMSRWSASVRPPSVRMWKPTRRRRSRGSRPGGRRRPSRRRPAVGSSGPRAAAKASGSGLAVSTTRGRSSTTTIEATPPVGQLVAQLDGAVLGRLEPVGVAVAGRHRARGVEDEHGVLGQRRRRDPRRVGHRQGEQGDGEQLEEQQHRRPQPLPRPGRGHRPGDVAPQEGRARPSRCSRRGRRTCSSSDRDGQGEQPSAAGLAKVTRAATPGRVARRVPRRRGSRSSSAKARDVGGAACSGRRAATSSTHSRADALVVAELLGGERHGHDLAGLGVDEVEVAGEVGVRARCGRGRARR